MLHDLFINATIIITFITLGNQFFKEREITGSSTIAEKGIFGFITGILGCILMLYSVRIFPHIIVDFRNIAIIIACIFGGLTSSIAASLIIGTFRIVYFGITTSSITALILAVLMGIVCGVISIKGMSSKKKWLYSTLACTGIGSIGFIILVSNMSLLITLLITYWIGSFLVVIVLYNYINNLMVSNQLFKKYKEESKKDFLTGLNNVRQFDKDYNSVTSRVVEKGEHLSLLMIDIDFFKRVNDTYGHVEGDIVLKELGKILLTTCRDFDIVSRNGGEEFSVMLMDCLPQQALIISERIRFAVEKHVFILSSGKKIHITISIGVASYPETTKDFNDLIKGADKALYRAKQTGRNKVIFQEG